MEERKWWGAPEALPPRKNKMVFGCLADTAAPLTAAEAAALRKVFRGVDMILHAGPLGSLRVVEQLEDLAPVAAVGGPSEDAVIRSSTYVRQVLRFGDQALGLMHGYGKPQGQKAFLLSQFEETPVQCLVFGHNREGQARPGGGVLFFNPGSFQGRPPEGKKNGHRTVGLLYLSGKNWEGQVTPLRP